MHPSRVKALAHGFDPECWISYSGKEVHVKQAIDARRNAALKWASENEWRLPWNLTIADIKNLNTFCRPEPCTMTPYRIGLMIHFYAICEAYPERNSEAYRDGVRFLLKQEMIRPTTEREQGDDGGRWCYTATDKGRTYVEALTALPLPVSETRWVMPK